MNPCNRMTEQGVYKGMAMTPDGSKDKIETTRSRIDNYLDMRDAETGLPSDDSSVQDKVFFKRKRSSAERTAERIMDRIMHEPASLSEATVTRTRRIPRLATILAAAALLIMASSAITAIIIRKQNVAEITFVIVAPDAHSVSLVGDFNGWSLESDRLERTMGDGLWRITVRLPKGRAYYYNFVLDNTRWIADPKALFKLDDGLGGTVSSLVL